MRDTNWHEHWMKHAYLAAEMGTCCRRDVGAVAVRDNRLLASGFNGNAPGALHCADGGCQACTDNDKAFAPPASQWDQCVCIHAETNVIAFSARHGIRLDGATIYTTTQPCLQCMKQMAVSGIVTVVYDGEYPSPVFDHPTLEVKKIHKSGGLIGG